MKKFLIILAGSLVILFFADRCWGILCGYWNSRAKGGSTEMNYYIAEKMDADVVMMGSSRMAHHYNPQIVEDMLGLTCYNTGADGNGIIMAYGFYKIFSKRYTPKLIIYDISSFDLFIDDNTKYLGWLRAFYDKEGISEIFADISPSEKIKMKSYFWFIRHLE